MTPHYAGQLGSPSTPILSAEGAIAVQREMLLLFWGVPVVLFWLEVTPVVVVFVLSVLYLFILFYFIMY